MLRGEHLRSTEQRVLRQLTSAVSHRGPESQTFREDGPVGFGFTRLSLVGLEGGQQPLASPDGALALIANGEVYNHHGLRAGLGDPGAFVSTSDCEVLLHLYRRDGLRFLDDVRGIFAVALWDRDSNQLVLARDRFGVKPLYFHQDHDRIVLASEVTALLQAPGVRTGIAWDRALADQLMTSEPQLTTEPTHSWFEQVHAVPAGTIVTIDLRDGTRTEHRYWDLPEHQPDDTATAQDFVDEYHRLLRSSVHESGTADVEVGLLLSGGIDSASIAALAPRPLRTFSSLTTGTVANGDVEFSRRVSRDLGLENHQVRFDATSVPSPSQWRRFLWLMETPLAGPEAFYKHELYRYVRAVAPQIKAMMIGGGADEFNGGYSTSFAAGGDWADFEQAIASMRLSARLRARPGLAPWWSRAHAPLLRDSALSDLNEPDEDTYSAFMRWKYRDVQQYNCWHEDRTAAGHGIEGRVPFLDHRLIELGSRVPTALRQELFWDKAILRSGMESRLGRDVAWRPKVPFFYGPGVGETYRLFARTLLQQDAVLLEQATASESFRRYVDVDAVRAALIGYAAGQADPVRGPRLEHLLRLVNLGLLDTMARDASVLPDDEVGSPLPVGVRADAEVQRAIDGVAPATVSVEPSCVPSWGEGALLLQRPNTDEWFLALDGALEFQFDAEADARWLQFLRLVDGRRSVLTLSADSGCAPHDVQELVRESVAAGLLRLTDVEAMEEAGTASPAEAAVPAQATR